MYLFDDNFACGLTVSLYLIKLLLGPLVFSVKKRKMPHVGAEQP